MLGKTRLKVLGTTALAMLAVGGCVSNDVVRGGGELCDAYCDARTVAEPSVFQLVKPTRIGGSLVGVPMEDFYVMDGDRGLVTPLDTTYGMRPGRDGPPPLDKSQGLDPKCFSRAPYNPVPLGTIDLDYDNTTITLVNFDRDGRLESRVLDDQASIFPRVEAILQTAQTPGSGPEYLKLQELLTRMQRPSTDSLFTQNVEIPRRDLGVDGVPPEKTPFYKDLTKGNFSDAEGHVFFYVLLDEHLEFARDYAALVTYAPSTQASLGSFYTPFVQYPVMPSTPDGTRPKPGTPDASLLDVMVFHFIRDTNFKAPDDLECRYVYDKQVISRGQFPFDNFTPMKIDPEIKSKGVILPD